MITGLPNHRLYENHLATAHKKFKEIGVKYSVIMLDIDNFKNVNDDMGHDIGDEVIDEFGKRLSKVIETQDVVARLGGDEFVILLPDVTTIDHIIHRVETIQEAVREPWKIQAYELKITTSIGIAMSLGDASTSHSIMKNADMALNEVKSVGGHVYKIHN